MPAIGLQRSPSPDQNDRAALKRCAIHVGAGLPAIGLQSSPSPDQHDRAALKRCAIPVGAGLPAIGLQRSPSPAQRLPLRIISMKAGIAASLSARIFAMCGFSRIFSSNAFACGKSARKSMFSTFLPTA